MPRVAAGVESLLISNLLSDVMVQFSINVPPGLWNETHPKKSPKKETHVGSGLDDEYAKRIEQLAQEQIIKSGHHHADGSPIKLHLESSPIAKEWDQGIAKTVGEEWEKNPQSENSSSREKSMYTQGAVGGGNQSHASDYHSAGRSSAPAASFGCDCGANFNILLGGAPEKKDPTKTEYHKGGGGGGGIGPSVTYSSSSSDNDYSGPSSGYHG